MGYKYDVVLSFSSEKEDEIAEIATFLVAASLQVFFYKDRQQELLSQNLLHKTYRIYHEESLVKVLFLSPNYAKKRLTQLEKRLAKDSTKMQKERLIIVNYMGDGIDPEFKDVIYIDGTKMKTDEIAMLIAERVYTIKRELKSEKLEDMRGKTVVYQNQGIVAGDNASFHNIKFN